MSCLLWSGPPQYIQLDQVFEGIMDAILCMHNNIALMHYGVISVNCKFQAYWITQLQQVLGMMGFTGRAASQPSHKY